MSTRAVVIIKSEYDTLIFYRHSDGYPEHAGKDVTEFVQDYKTGKMRLDAMQSSGWLVVRGHKEYGPQSKGMEWKVGAYEPTSRIPSDVEYLYIIDLAECKLTCRVPKGDFWDNPSLENTASLKGFKTVSFKGGAE